MGKKTQKSKSAKSSQSSPMPKSPKIIDPESAWKKSSVGEVDLNLMVVDGIIQPEKEIEWKSSLGQPFPTEAQEEIVLFKSFCERGFALPASDFFRELLQFYGLELHHLTPNGISYIANFQHFFEAFLGIEPSLPFFRYIFHVKGQPTNQNPRVVGRAGIQLRQGSSVQWF
jgi:hypothetical protein